VVDGIWQYGNALGVPNIGGDTSSITALMTTAW